MPRERSGARVAERLLLLTLTLDEAIRAGDRGDVEGLLDARAETLAELTEREIDDETKAVLGRVRQAEETLLEKAEVERSRLVEQIVRSFQDRRSMRGYGGARHAASLDQLG